MTNGFYKTEHLEKDIKRKIIKEAIGLSFHVTCEEKYRGSSSRRQIYSDLSINDVIKNGLEHASHTLSIVDRVLYNGESFNDTTDYEICLHYDWRFLYIFVSKDSFDHLVSKYKLTLQEY